MDQHDNSDLDALLEDLPGDTEETPAPPSPAAPRRDPMNLLARIPVRLTLEVGNTIVSLAELMAIEQGSVLELDRLAGEPLEVKVNGTAVGQAEVVVCGENYGLKVLHLEDLGRFMP
ncbi:flagellar motor switch protein FliN [Pandoraea pulmonicola]|uniref:Flagellar motor switch protein FliN n=1 Tax=Pandoraea pulmonicola TaxID=93221 RepID=A0AAJ4ZB21_PANPU|nr:flagellar motor switch protein FliN [Pandoraea pulmonicola]AJC21212.1 flagellar motor switch protein FliN [Pandoraea pulmonicola]SUA90108.1 Flagellar motor switch protein FliN [Pandoraea pulmonicola]